MGTLRSAGERALQEALALLDAVSLKRRLALIAIDGPAYAGKSTLAAAIHREWPETETIHVDDFYPARDEPLDTVASLEQDYQQLFDWARLRDDLLLPLIDAKHVRYQRPGWRTRSLSGGWVTIEPRGIVIVEGVSSMRRELSALYSATIFVDTPEQERARRALSVQNDAASIERREAIVRWYLEHERPAERADLVISGDGIP